MGTAASKCRRVSWLQCMKHVGRSFGGGGEMGISKVMSHIWQWDGVDADHGFPIVGCLSDIAGSLILIDPPETSGTKEQIESAGKPQAIVLTSQWHVRGAPHWAEELGLSIYAPASAKGELDEAGGKL